MSKQVLKLFILGIISSILVACTSKEENKYLDSIHDWHQLRVDWLKGETGFLNLAGLFWLEPGVNTFGADSTNDLVFPAAGTPFLGSFLLRDSIVQLITSAPILIEGVAVSDTTLVYNDSIAPAMAFASLHWFVIKRGGNIGVRLRDFENPLIQSFDSIDYFETNPDWKVEATWISYDEPIKIPFSNVLGMTIEYPVYGAFSFKIEGQEYQLEPMGKPGPEGYFVMFYDKTSGHTTYGSGRYLYIEPANEAGEAVVDFNKAYNPPCVFTEFATCLFPHKKNRLPIFVKAGEKFSGH